MPDPGRIGGPVIVPNCVACKIIWTLPDTRVAVNVLHGIVAGGFAPTVALANAIQAALTTGAEWTALRPFLHTATFLTAVELLDIRAPNLAPVRSTNAAVAGTGAGVPMAPQTALVVTLRTALAGIANRGRAYVPGFSSAAQQANQTASAAAVAALQAWSNNIWFAALTASGLALCLAHPARAAYVGATGTQHVARAAGTVPVTSAIVRNGIWDTQRRRAGRT